MPFEFKKLDIDGLVLVKPKVSSDNLYNQVILSTRLINSSFTFEDTPTFS